MMAIIKRGHGIGDHRPSRILINFLERGEDVLDAAAAITTTMMIEAIFL